MHQTLYIDIDEEITSVVERLRKAQASEIVMVVPKRAMLIQSIVNLRLLKKEADSLGLQLMIVTQDKLGKLLVEKAGILVQQKLDDSLEEESIEHREERDESMNLENIQFSSDSNKEETGKSRLDRIGSSSFFDESGGAKKEDEKPIRTAEESEGKEAERIVNKELVVNVGKDIRKKAHMDLAPRSVSPLETPLPSAEKNMSESFRDSSFANAPKWDNYISEKSEERPAFSASMDKLENFYHHNNHVNDEPYKDKNERPSKPVLPKEPRSFKGLVWAVVIILMLAAVGGAAYYLVPHATINLTVKEKVKEQDSEVTARADLASLDLSEGAIPAKLISISDEVTQSFNVSGSKTGLTGPRAHGTITIYNEFSTVSQPLVANTRFVTDDGKIFRLNKAVTVPGTKDGKAGTIDADVTADSTGESFNIGPSKFNIPGFEDNKDKYAKIYGKSTEAMTGGGSSDSNSNSNQQSAATIADSDIANAKTQIQKQLTDSVKKKIKSSVEDGWVLSDDAISIDEAIYKSSNTVGQKVESFQMTATTKASALVFKEKDLKDVVGNIIAKASGGNIKTDGAIVTLEYGKLLPDFRAGTLDIKAHGVMKSEASLDVDKFKEDILGKTNDDLEAYLSSYPDIDNVEVTYWPPFISSKIPMSAERVEVVVDNKN